MYTSIYSLPQNGTEESTKFQNRWKTKEGILSKHHILKLLRHGASEHFLQKDFIANKLSILENETDLKGLYLVDEVIKTHHPKTFNNVNLSYSFITHSKFEEVAFPNMLFRFATLRNVTFINCTFSSTIFYACRLENVAFINCDFIERVDVRNCRFYDVRFKNCFFEANIFYNCKFDEGTIIDEPVLLTRYVKKQIAFDKKEYAELYKGIKNSYLEGNVIARQRKYYFLERQAITRYNITDFSPKVGNYILEFIAGYGIRPMRVLVNMALIFLFFTALFIARLGYPDGLLLSMGAYFTNGANTQYLITAGGFYQLLYILEAFFGIVFSALFITVMANLWFSEK